MSVLVTGGAGYIGSHMVLELIAAGEEVVVLDNLSTGIRRLVHREAKLHVGDVADQLLVSNLIRDHHVDAVIHFAGSIVNPESFADPLGYYLNNTVRSRALIEACVNSGVKHFIFSSTAAVYGLPQVNPVSEDAPANPVSPYGKSKLMTEWMLRDAAAAHDFNAVALRYFNVAGADPQARAGQASPKATQLIKLACQVAAGARACLDIYGRDYETADGTCIRDYIHVSDLASAHSGALSYLRGGGGTVVLNCGYGKGSSVLDVVGSVERALGAKIATRDMPRREGDQGEVTAAAGRIRAVLGWQPQHDDLDTIIAHGLQWERALSRMRSVA